MTVKARKANERPHLLIVTDDRDLADFLGEGLVHAGFWTSVIASAIQTLEVFRLRTFDLAIVDASLSGLGAIELVRRLRSTDDTAATRTDIPIMLIAGDAGAPPTPIDPTPTSLPSANRREHRSSRLRVYAVELVAQAGLAGHRRFPAPIAAW